ncbi:hypothetical protein PJ15_0356 [Acinetobacter sp. neg1]|nr:hypothetical protein PJ15_0356 [Acinetobacter sp. neg1]
MIGSFHIAENIEQFKNKRVEIYAVHNFIAERRHIGKDIETLLATW